MTDWPIRSLHQIELTSHCNLRCVYCPSPTLGREKKHMDRADFLRSLEWVKHFVNEGTQGELNLAGIGESTLHPNFVEFVELAREALGWDQRVCFATNGLLMTPELARQLKPYKPTIWVSMHRPEKAKLAIDALREEDMLSAATCDPAIKAVDWAGQVKWGFTSPNFGIPCEWKEEAMAFVMADGRMSSCAFDSSGIGVIGHVRDEIGSVCWKPYELCKTCHQDCGVPGYRDRVEGKRQ